MNKKELSSIQVIDGCLLDTHIECITRLTQWPLCTLNENEEQEFLPNRSNEVFDLFNVIQSFNTSRMHRAQKIFHRDACINSAISLPTQRATGLIFNDARLEEVALFL